MAGSIRLAPMSTTTTTEITNSIEFRKAFAAAEAAWQRFYDLEAMFGKNSRVTRTAERTAEALDDIVAEMLDA